MMEGDNIVNAPLAKETKSRVIHERRYWADEGHQVKGLQDMDSSNRSVWPTSNDLATDLDPMLHRDQAGVVGP